MDDNLTLMENVRELISDPCKDPVKKAKIFEVLRTQNKSEIYSWEITYPTDLLENDGFYEVWDKLVKLSK